MPREEVEWAVTQAMNGDARDQARQCCTYYSIVSVDKRNSPFSSSFEREQTWTLTRTTALQNKRYQTSIENIRLTVPPVATVLVPKPEPRRLDRSISLLPPSRQPAASSDHLHKPRVPLFTNPMRIMHINGEFVVRI